MGVHVSIHDVSPAFKEEIELALTLCLAAGARPALLVVPNFHDTSPLRADPAFCNRLRELQGHGHEIFLHGYRHQAHDRYDPKRVKGRVGWVVAQKMVSAHEAEMRDVSEENGRSLVHQGETSLHDIGLDIDGYVAPAWCMPVWLRHHLASRGYSFTEDRFRVYDPSLGRSRPSLVLNWATRSRLRLAATLAFSRAGEAARPILPIRIAIHPADMHFLAVRREIARCLAWAAPYLVPRAKDLLGGAP